eukprot:2783565-Amphidinium_carterae.1
MQATYGTQDDGDSGMPSALACAHMVRVGRMPDRKDMQHVARCRFLVPVLGVMAPTLRLLLAP